jgi:dolichol-phosphate mannosyltransferase
MNISSLRLSVIIPTFNEAENIRELLRALEQAMGPDGWEAIIVDDDSPDATAALVRALGLTDSRVRCLQRIGRRGLASACIEGMMGSSAPVIAIMDADLQHDVSILPAMLEAIEQGADLVIGSRYMQGGSTGEWTAARKTISLFATRMSRMVLKQAVSDPMSGFFMLRRNVLDDCVRNLSGMGFKILLDLLASVSIPLRIVEIPYHFHERMHGQSKLDNTVVWEYGMLLADKLVGRFVPVRFLAFAFIGGLGVFVHLAVLSLSHKAMGLDFALAQTLATGISMIFNFALNNALTYRDRQLKGWGWFRGLLSFVLACSIGGVANIGIATYLFEHRTSWLPAALAGILVGAVWNYTVTQLYTWGKK